MHVNCQLLLLSFKFGIHVFLLSRLLVKPILKLRFISWILLIWLKGSLMIINIWKLWLRIYYHRLMNWWELRIILVLLELFPLLSLILELVARNEFIDWIILRVKVTLRSHISLNIWVLVQSRWLLVRNWNLSWVKVAFLLVWPNWYLWIIG